VVADTLARATEGQLLRSGDKALLDMFSFLVKGYRPPFWFWELAVVARKVLILSISVFGNAESELQACWASLVLFTCTAIHLHFKPFSTQLLNNLESLSLVATSSIFLLGAFLRRSEEGSGWGIVISLLIFACVVAATGVFAYYIVRTSKLQEKIKRVKGRFSSRRFTAKDLAAKGPKGKPPQAIQFSKLTRDSASSPLPSGALFAPDPLSAASSSDDTFDPHSDSKSDSQSDSKTHDDTPPAAAPL
jgi:hypothetical protein